MAVNLWQQKIANIKITIAEVDKLDAVELKQAPYLCRDLSHFFAANYGFVHVQSLPSPDYILPHEFYELKYINDSLYISDRALIKYWGKKKILEEDLPIKTSALVNDLFVYLEGQNLYQYSQHRPERGYDPPFAESILGNNTFSVSRMGFLRHITDDIDQYHRAIISNAGFFMLDSCEDDSDFTCIGDIDGLYGHNGGIDSPALYSKSVLIARTNGEYLCTIYTSNP